MRRRLLRVLIGIALITAVPGSAVSGSEGRILGKVVDAQGDSIDGVLVSIQAIRVEFEKRAFTNRKGRFSIILVDAAGEYEILLSKEGFQSLREPIHPKVGGLLRQTWTLIRGTNKELEAAQALSAVEILDEAAKIYNRGADAYRRGDEGVALEQFERSATLNPVLTAPLIGMARIHFAQSDFEDALSRVETLLQLEPANVAGLRIRYDVLAELDRQDDADAALELLLAADATPGTARRVFNRGVEAVRSNNLRNAAGRFEKAVEIDATLTPALLALAQVYLTLHEPDRAIEFAERVVEQEVKSTEALSVLYQAHLNLGNEASAQAAFESLQSIDPSSVAQAFYKEGVAQFNAGNIELATKTLERVLEAEPEHAKAHYNLGLCYLNLGDTVKARDFFNRFIELAPADPDVSSAQEMLSYLH